MKHLTFGCLLALAATLLALQAPRPMQIERITWSHPNLTWVTSEGRLEGQPGARKYVPEVMEDCEIDLDKATMTCQGETRKFAKEEADKVHELLDALDRYAVESILWWKAGKGENADKPRSRAD